MHDTLGGALNNILLAFAIIGSAFAWRQANFWLPRSIPLSVRARRWALRTAGVLVLLLVGGFGVGDAVGGRAQITRSPVQYATRLTGDAAHHHDLADAGAFWRQVAMELTGAILVGGLLIVLSRATSATSPHRIA